VYIPYPLVYSSLINNYSRRNKMSASDRYTNENLIVDLKSGCPGDKNAAPYLLELDTPERRLRAVSEAHTLSNLLGFRYSEAVYNAVRELKNNIANGEEDKELYGQATARKYREAEAERKRLNFGY
jgi:hypothetical protein